MYKIAVLGDRESICGFACLGLITVCVIGEDDAKAEFKRLTCEDYAVIYITENFGQILKEEIDKFRFSATPAIILIPGITGNTGDGMKNIAISVEKAVGSQLLD